MRLEKLRRFLEEKDWEYTYTENDDCGSVDFERKGLVYHVWEFPGDPRGAESNLRTVARFEDYFGDYEQDLIDLIRSWGD